MKKFFSLLLMMVATVLVSSAASVTIWSEDWSSGTAGQKPSEVTNANATYSETSGSSTKLYAKSSFTDPELLVAKKSNNDDFFATINLNGASGELTLEFDCNRNLTITSSTTGVTVGTFSASNNHYTGTITVPSGTSSLALQFHNDLSNNARLSNLVLTYEQSGGDDPQPSEFAAPTFSFTENALVENGDAKIIMPENATSLNYWYGTDGNIAVLDRVDQTATANVVLDLSQFSLRDYVYVNAQAVYANGESDVVSTALYVGDPNYEFPLVFTAEPTEGGTITGPSTAQGGETVTFTVSPAEGYTLKNVTAKYTEFGEPYGGNDIVVGENSFTMPAYTKIDVKNEPSVFITANFEKEAPTSGTYDVTFVAGTDKGSQTGQGTYEDVITKTGVTLTGHNTPLGNTDNYRVYQNQSIELSVATGKITQIVMTSTANKGSKYGPDLVKASEGTYSTEDNSKVGTWTGSATSVTFTASAQARFTTIAVTVEASEDAILNPVIEGTTPFLGSTEVTITNPNETGEIRYTLDGSDPDANATLYSAPFSLTETTTVKAIAIVDGKSSSIVEKEFVTVPGYATLAEVIALPNNTNFVFTGEVVVLRQYNNNFLYVQDDNKGNLIYGNVGQTYKFGDVIPAGWAGTATVYSSAPEITNPAGFEASISNVAPKAIELTVDQITADNFSRYAVVRGATVSATGMTVDETTVPFRTNRTEYTLPEDLTKTYDVYGITDYTNSGAQFMPLSFEEVQAATYTVTVAENIENGTISDITAETATAGTEVMFEVTPAEHYAIDAVTVTGVTTNQSVELTNDGNIYSFSMPADDVVINATFKQVEFQVALNYNAEQATVDGVVNDWYAAGENITFEVAPAEGYQLNGVTITAGNDPVEFEQADNMYSFTMPESDVNINVATELIPTYTITVAENIENGTISDITAETATAGTEVMFEVTPAEHYAIDAVTVNCVNINQAVELTNDGNIYSFSMPADDVVINATFKQVEFQVALNYNAEQATIDGVQNEQYVAAGEEVLFEVTPAQGYQLTGVTITAGNEAIVPEVAENTYSFIMPESDVNINVATELIPAKTYPINVQAMENGSVVADPIAAAIGETVILTVTPADGYELETISVTAGREIQGGSGGARAPHVKMWQSQGNIELTKVDDTHYTFVLPEELPNVLTPNYTDDTEFKVSATFKLAPVPTRVITGKVVDKKGNALEGVSVVALVKNVEPAGISHLKAEGDLSTTTDENGEFSLEVPADQQYDLTFSKAGYKSQTVGEDEVPGTGLVMAKDYPTAIDAIVADENVAGVKYVSVNGQVSDQPFDGVNIVVIEKVDGTKTVTKIRK